MSLVWNKSSTTSLPDDWIAINNLNDLTARASSHATDDEVWLLKPNTTFALGTSQITLQNKILYGGVGTSITGGATSTGTSNANITLNDNCELHNIAFVAEAGLDDACILVYSSGSNIILDRCKFTTNSSNDFYFIESGDNDLLLRDCIFTSTVVSSYCVIVGGGSVNMQNCAFNDDAVSFYTFSPNNGTVWADNCKWYDNDNTTNSIFIATGTGQVILSNPYFGSSAGDITIGSTVDFQCTNPRYSGHTGEYLPSANSHTVFNLSGVTSGGIMFQCVCTQNTWVQFTTESGYDSNTTTGNSANYLTIGTTTNPSFVLAASTPAGVMTLILDTYQSGSSGTDTCYFGVFNSTNPSETTDFGASACLVGTTAINGSQTVQWYHPGGSATYRIFGMKTSTSTITISVRAMQLQCVFD